MKIKNLTEGLLFAAIGLGLFGCKAEEIIQKNVIQQENIIYEQTGDAAFLRRSDMILLEVTVPENTRTSDQIYIVGEFNGGDSAIGKYDWMLDRCPDRKERYGIYLDPATFVQGKTLADGYHFVSRREGRELDASAVEVTHNDAPGIAERAYLTVEKWETSFVPLDEDIEHDGPVVFVKDQTGWDKLFLHVSGEAGQVLGAAPGKNETGIVNIGGSKWKYFDLTSAATGKDATLTFGNGSTTVSAVSAKFDYNHYFELTAQGAKEVQVFPDHDGIRIYVDNRTEWDDFALYLWGDTNDFGGTWPGKAVTGQMSYLGYDYVYFEYDNDLFGLSENLIFNNNKSSGSDQLDDYSIKFEEGVADYFLMVTKAGVVKVDPAARTGKEIALEPEPEVMGYTLYIENKTSWDGVNVYYWGDGYTPVKWPGKVLEDYVEIDGVKYYKVLVEESAEGVLLNFIFSNTSDTSVRVRMENFFTMDGDKYISLTDDASTTALISNPNVGTTFLIKDDTGWPMLKVYYWWYTDEASKTTADNAKFPGEEINLTRTVDGVEYKVLELPKSLLGTSVNFQFINGESTSTKLKTTVKLSSGEKIYTLTPTSFTEGASDGGDDGPEYEHTVYIKDDSGYPGLTVYYWWNEGSSTADNTKFPGETVSETTEIDGVMYKVLHILKKASGKTVNFQFVSSADTKTKVKASFSVSGDLFIALTSSKAEIDTSLDVTLYVLNNVATWKAKGYFYCYLYGGNLSPSEYYGKWAGKKSSDTVERDGKTYYVFSIPRGLGKNTKMQFSNDDDIPSSERIRIKTPSNVTLSSEMYITLEDGNSAPVITTSN